MEVRSVSTLVVYYSRTGNTRLIAETIAEKLNADIDEIKDIRGRLGVFGFLRSGYEAIVGKPAEIQPLQKNVEEYSLVIVGSPVWVGRLSSPVRAYLFMCGGKIENIAFFTTCKTSSNRAISQMEALSKPPIATLEVKEKEVRSNKYQQKVEEFAEKIKGWFKAEQFRTTAEHEHDG
jgi:flavodoxin